MSIAALVAAGDAIAVDVSGGDVTLDPPSMAMYIGVAGDIKVDLVSGATLTFSNRPVGDWPVRVKKVYQTGTAASGIIAYRRL